MRTILTKFFKSIGFSVAILSAAMTAEAAGIYNGNFSAAGTQGSPADPGYYFFIGDNASQTFAGTGLNTVDQISLTLNFGPGGVDVDTPLVLGFRFGGASSVPIGFLTYNPLVSTVQTLNVNLSDVSLTPFQSSSGDWTLSMFVSTPVCSGCGAVHFSIDNPLTLTSNASVPVPGSLALLGLGLLVFAVPRKRV